MNSYIVGTRVALVASFTTEDGTLADPTSVTAEIILPDSTIVQLPQPFPQSTGVWETTFLTTVAGLHQFRFAGTGALSAAAEGSFYAQTAF